MAEIYEDKYTQEHSKYLHELNTDEQIKRGNFYKTRYELLKAEMEVKEAAHKELEDLYKCEQEEVDGSPNAFIPLIAPIIDGHVSSMTEQNITSNVKGKRMSDQAFSRDAQSCIDLMLKESDIRQRLKVGIKRYTLFGWGVIAIDYDKTALDGIGLAKFRFPPIHKIFVDGNIKDMADSGDAQYIIEEIGFQSIMWARQEFGDDIADFIQVNNSDALLNKGASCDEEYSFMYLKVWHRNNKKRNLQLLEMDGTGFVIRESSPDKPYYEYVENRYPYKFFGLYHEEGEFARFGEGKRLKYMQELLNNLYNEVITAIQYNSQGKKFIDPAGNCDPDEVADADPSKPVICNDPKNNVYVLQGTGIHPVVLQIITLIVQESQRVARFSALMTGNSTGERITATQAGLQQQQGNTNISDKKQDVSSALSKAAQYGLEICMEKWNSGVDIYEDDQHKKAKWLDVRRLAKIPVQVPIDGNFKQQWKDKNESDHTDLPLPEFMNSVASEDIMDDNGEMLHAKGTPISKKANFDIEISIGEGLPTNKIAVYNIILSLAQLQLIDESTGMPRPLLGYSQVKRMIEDLVGLPIDEALEDAKQTFNQYGIPQPKVPPVNVNPNIPGANMGGNMSGAAMGGGGIPA